MTITSFTDTSKKYETTLTSCSCPDHQYRNRQCKHMRMIAEEVERAERFLALKKQYEQPQRLYSQVCGHLVRRDVTKHCGCMA